MQRAHIRAIVDAPAQLTDAQAEGDVFVIHEEIFRQAANLLGQLTPHHHEGARERFHFAAVAAGSKGDGEDASGGEGDEAVHGQLPGCEN